MKIHRVLETVKVFLLGMLECRGDFGRTYDDDPNSPLSRAYDAGRYFWTKE